MQTIDSAVGPELPERRRVLAGATVATGALILAAATTGNALAAGAPKAPQHTGVGPSSMRNTITSHDGTSIFYKDWGNGRPVVFSHGWPLNADAWDQQLMFMAEHGYRAVAHDRRSHGRSTQTFTGNDMDTYADDLAELMEKLDLRETILVGHSTGGGEVAHYLGRHGTSRVSKAVLVGAVPPLMLKTPTNPGGLDRSVFDAIRQGTWEDRSQFYKDLTLPFYGFIDKAHK